MKTSSDTTSKRRTRRSLSPKRALPPPPLKCPNYRDKLREWIGDLAEIDTWTVGGRKVAVEWQRTFEGLYTFYNKSTINYAEIIAWLYWKKDYIPLQILLQRVIELHRKFATTSKYSSLLLAIGAHVQRMCIARERQRDALLWRLVDMLDTDTDFVRITAAGPALLYTPEQLTTAKVMKWSE